jgi:hypothetical protein
MRMPHLRKSHPIEKENAKLHLTTITVTIHPAATTHERPPRFFFSFGKKYRQAAIYPVSENTGNTG